MAFSKGLVITENTLGPNLKRFPGNVKTAIEQTMDFFTPRVESFARSNAPWADRTGNARTGLRANAIHLEISDAIELSHAVPYGIWLEVRNDGRFAIIIPTIQATGRELMATFRSLFGRVRK